MTNPGTANLVACYELEENTGTRYDAHGSADLTDGSSVPRNTGVVGYGADFGALSSDYLYRTGDTALDLSGGDFTICFWYRPGVMNAVYQIMVRQAAGNTRSWALTMLSGNNVRASLSSGASWTNVDHSAVLSTATWYFVYFRFNDSANLFYVNVYGATEVSNSFASTIYSGSNSVYVGSTPTPSSYLDGRLDQIMIFDDWVTDTEITWLHNSASGRAYSELSTGVSIPVAMATYRRRRSGLWAP